MVNCWVNFTTFARDIEWMRYSLESFRKYCTGFAGVTICVPTWDVDKFRQFERYSTPDCPIEIHGFLEYPGKGFVNHLAIKCSADLYAPKATHILHMDPDCLFSAPQTPYDYLAVCSFASTCTSDQDSFYVPVLVIEPYEVLKTVHPARYNWKQVTEFAVGFTCTHETMCRHPAVHVPTTYRYTRNLIEEVHKCPFYDFVLRQKNQYPQGFGEFNTLGAVAYERFKDSYKFIDRGDKGIAADPTPKVWQGWSYTGAHSKDNFAKIKEILA